MNLKSVIKISMLLFVVTAALASCTDDDGVLQSMSQPQSIHALRKVTITDELLFGETVIPGVVVSDSDNGNIEENYIVVQDPDNEAAVILQMKETSILKLGDNVFLNLAGATMVEESGEKVVKNVLNSNVYKVNGSKQVNPKVTDITALKENGLYWGPVVVKINSVVLSGGQNGKYQGNIQITDEYNSSVPLKVLTTSSMSEEKMVKQAGSVTCLPRFINDELFLYPRNLDDVVEKDTVDIIAEGFEDVVANNGYEEITAQFSTGSWTISGGITATSGYDKKTGSQSIRLQGTPGNDMKRGVIEMNFGLENVFNVSFNHGIYPASGELANTNPTTVALEMSADEGQTYTVLGTATITIREKEDSTLDFAEFEVPQTDGPVRFRVVNTSAPLDNGNRPRVNIDDITFSINTSLVLSE